MEVKIFLATCVPISFCLFKPVYSAMILFSTRTTEYFLGPLGRRTVLELFWVLCWSESQSTVTVYLIKQANSENITRDVAQK